METTLSGLKPALGQESETAVLLGKMTFWSHLIPSQIFQQISYPNAVDNANLSL